MIDLPILVSQHTEVLDRLQANGASTYGRDGWLSIGAVENFTFQTSRIGGDWGLVWGLLDTRYLVLTEPLRSMIDSGKHLDLFSAVWDIRFQLDEGQDVRPLVESMTQWLVDGEPCPHLGLALVSQEQRLDHLLFLLTLAAQNELVSPSFFVYSSIERATQQEDEALREQLLNGLLLLIELIEQWAPLGSPAGLFLRVSDLDVVNGRLRDKIESLLVPHRE